MPASGQGNRDKRVGAYERGGICKVSETASSAWRGVRLELSDEVESGGRRR